MFVFIIHLFLLFEADLQVLLTVYCDAEKISADVKYEFQPQIRIW